MADFVNASTDREIVFTRNASEAINLVAYTWGMANLKPGDEVVVSVLEHHSNLVPWQIVCEKTAGPVRESRPDASKPAWSTLLNLLTLLTRCVLKVAPGFNPRNHGLTLAHTFKHLKCNTLTSRVYRIAVYLP